MAISALLGQFQKESGYQVLPPRRRWDLCPQQLHQFGRKDRSFRFVGGGPWRCRAQQSLRGLATFWYGCRPCEINSGVWNWKKSKSYRIHDLTSMFATKLDCQLVQVLMFCSCSCPLHEQGAGWLFEIISISDYEFDLNQDGGQSSYVIIHDMWCKQWSIAFLTLTTFGLRLPSNQRMNRIEQVLPSLAIFAELWGM